MPGDGADQDGRSGAAAARAARNRSDRLPSPVAQWLADGNENIGCLDTTNDRELMYEVTSANFDGMIAVTQPDESWAARYKGLVKYVSGCYALNVPVELPQQHINTLEDNGAPSRHRPAQPAS